MRNSNETSLFSFVRSLEAEDQLLLSNPAQWRWAMTCVNAPETVQPIAHPRHQKWIATKGNVHTPSHREIMLMLHGDSVYGMGGKVYPRAPGHVFLFDHYESRDWIVAPWQKDFRTLWVHFPNRNHITYNTDSRDAKRRHYREITGRVFSSGAAIAPDIMAAWDTCKAYPHDTLYWDYLKALVTSMLLQILATVRPLPPESRHRQVISSVLDYIKTHLADDLNLSHLARMAGYSPFFFHRLFFEQTGQRPKEYVDRVRLEKACQLLRQGYTTAAVAAEIGFSTAYSFSRFFKHHLKESPQRWRMVESESRDH